MNYAEAIEALKQGKRVTWRSNGGRGTGWGVFLVSLRGEDIAKLVLEGDNPEVWLRERHVLLCTDLTNDSFGFRVERVWRMGFGDRARQDWRVEEGARLPRRAKCLLDYAYHLSFGNPDSVLRWFLALQMLVVRQTPSAAHHVLAFAFGEESEAKFDHFEQTVRPCINRKLMSRCDPKLAFVSLQQIAEAVLYLQPDLEAASLALLLQHLVFERAQLGLGIDDHAYAGYVIYNWNVSNRLAHLYDADSRVPWHDCPMRGVRTTEEGADKFGLAVARLAEYGAANHFDCELRFGRKDDTVSVNVYPGNGYCQQWSYKSLLDGVKGWLFSFNEDARLVQAAVASGGSLEGYRRCLLDHDYGNAQPFPLARDFLTVEGSAMKEARPELCECVAGEVVRRKRAC